MLRNGVFSVKDVVNPPPNPRLASLWVNQRGVFCRNRWGDIQLPQLLSLQSSTPTHTHREQEKKNQVQWVYYHISKDASYDGLKVLYFCRFSGVLMSSSYNVGCSSRVPLNTNSLYSNVIILVYKHLLLKLNTIKLHTPMTQGFSFPGPALQGSL